MDPVAGATSSITGGAVVVTGLSASPSQTTTVTFSAKTSCADGTHTWPLDARDSQNRAYSPTGDRQSQVTGSCALVFLNNPSNTKAGELITSGDRQAADAIQVQLVDDLVTPSPVTHFPMAVTFVLGNDPSAGTAVLSVTPETDAMGTGSRPSTTATARDQPRQRGGVHQLHARPAGQRPDVDHRSRLGRVRHLGGRNSVQRCELHPLPRWRRVRRSGRSGRSAAECQHVQHIRVQHQLRRLHGDHQ